ncbi:MAG: hypothetical protein AABW79_04465 [Nanoarchaeota archaeon]
MKKIVMVFAAVLILSTIAFAATLVKQSEVQSCLDTDGGVNVTRLGITYGVELSGSNFTLTDFCTNNSTLIEYACSNVNGTIYKQQWNQNCAQLNKTCSAGRCV